MKKLTLSLLAMSVAILMITSAYANCVPPMPAPRCMPCGCGFTPGFWKHNLKVYLGGPGNYNAFDHGLREGEKLTYATMTDLINDVNDGAEYTYTPQELLDFLKEKGNSPNRINTANWFNNVAGYGTF